MILRRLSQTLRTLLPPGEGARRADEGTSEAKRLALPVPSPQPLTPRERGFFNIDIGSKK